MKLIAVDNYDRESVADRLVGENMTEYNAQFLARAANEQGQDNWYYKAVPDEYVLWRGMADLV